MRSNARRYLRQVGKRLDWELIDGRFVPQVPVPLDVSWVKGNISGALTTWAESRELGFVFHVMCSFHIQQDPDTIVQPDVAFVFRHRLWEQIPGTCFAGAPDLAVEVLSPDDDANVIRRKMDRYLASGSRMTWLVDPGSETVEVQREGQDGHRSLGPGDYLTADGIVPGFAMPVSEVFAGCELMDYLPA